MKIIDKSTVESIATVNEWVEAMENAIRASLSGDIIMPQRSHIDNREDSFLIMPCIDAKYWSTKLVSFCPGNRDRGLKSIYGTVILNSSVTGEPLAVIEGTALTAYRTAAVTAMGIKYLSDEKTSTLGIIGTGTQGIRQAAFTCSIRSIRKVCIYDISETAARDFEKEFSKIFPQVSVSVMKETGSVCEESGIIITCTNSKKPVLPSNAELFSNRTFIGIGSYKPDCREYPDIFYSCVSQIFTDTMHGLRESGDLIYPVEKNLIKRENIISLGSLIENSELLLPGTTRFFKTVGSAVFDLYAASLIYEKSLI
jgi:ornithine cyclodeaminase